MELTRPAYRAVSGWRNSGKPAKGVREVTLIIEPGGYRDLAEGGVCFGYFTASKLNTQSSNEVSYRASEMLSKLSSQMDRMHTGEGGQLGQRRSLPNMRSKHLSNPVQ